MNYIVKYTKRKTIGIKVTLSEGLVVMAPLNCPKEIIEKVIKEKNSWILEAQRELERRATEEEDLMKKGQISFLGKVYPLRFRFSSMKSSLLTIKDEYAEVRLNALLQFHKEEELREIKKAIKSFYREEGKKILIRRTEYYSKTLKLTYNKITLKDMSSRWGSCSSKKNINYSLRLLLFPLELIDYVVVHELCHLIHMNHSKDFWQELERIMPDYKEREKKIKKLTIELGSYWVH